MRLALFVGLAVVAVLPCACSASPPGSPVDSPPQQPSSKLGAAPPDVSAPWSVEEGRCPYSRPLGPAEQSLWPGCRSSAAAHFLEARCYTGAPCASACRIEYRDIGKPVDFRVRYAHDALGRVVEEIEESWADGASEPTRHVTTCAFEGTRPSSCTYDGTVEQYRFDGAMLVEVRDEHRVTTWQHEGGRPLRRERRRSDGRIFFDVFSYDDAGRLAAQTDDLATGLRYRYDDRGRIAEVVSILTNDDRPRARWTYRWRPDGRLGEQTQALDLLSKEPITSRSRAQYDAQGRLAQILVSDPQDAPPYRSISFIYDCSAPGPSERADPR
ncbi:MAG: RHS repeat protein [Myxococcales bacterium]|nr:RHS repeat protein [Myxococcales bacterium]